MTHQSESLTGKPPERILSTLHPQPLADTDLHVWCTPLNGSSDEIAYCRSLLSQDEKERADRFYFERDRSHYVVGRGVLRVLLGSYLGIEARKIRVSYGPHGKPMLQDTFDNKLFQFNLSNANGWAVLIFGWNHPLGIDLEHVRPFDEADDFARHYYSNRETALLNSLSGDKKWDAFFKFWTPKESFL